ncbi:MAG: TetR/AcrR family transcriptional regulator [Spongiibacteraceae bacterium]|jgi:AcrR family transcriptional regulator|nr:TetR/AcrR family transcriptional regulator [Spongiibacteraceae bacterium]
MPYSRKRAPAVPADVSARLHPTVFDELSSKGWNQINIRQIATRSGVSSATIYKYYGSKEQLVLAVVDEWVGELMQAVIEHVADARSYRDKWYRLFQAQLGFSDRNPQFAILTTIHIPGTIWFSASTMPTRMIQRVYKPLLREGRRLGVIDSRITTEHLIRQVYMNTIHETQRWYAHGQKWSLASRVDDFFFMFWKAISATA